MNVYFISGSSNRLQATDEMPAWVLKLKTPDDTILFETT